jgi:hypothetical protein
VAPLFLLSLAGSCPVDERFATERQITVGAVLRLHPRCDCAGRPGTWVYLMTLLSHHLDDLRRSGLSEATIFESGVYSESDPSRLAKLLNWKRPATNIGAGLVFPFLDVRTGGLNCFARVKPDKPRLDGGKYEQPRGAPIRAYIPRGALHAINSLEPIGFTEGEKKSLAATQCGLPCIGLTGVWGWQKPRKKNAGGKPIGDRELIDDLAVINWAGRRVWICFDFDPRRNPSVNQAAAELVRVLSGLGAIAVIIRLPAGGRDARDVPLKLAIDDYLVANGEESLRRLVCDQISGPQQPTPLSTYRSELSRIRVESIGRPGINLDNSPAGAGKTFADVDAILRVEKSLTLLPAHDNCREVAKMYRSHNLDAAALPQISSKTCKNWSVAEKAIDSGLSASQAVCPTCPHKPDCDYHAQLKSAEKAEHRIATHHRAGLSFGQLAEGREFIAIHEDPISVLRPTFEVARGLEEVSRVADEAITIVQNRNWTLDGDRSDEHFLHRMVTIADGLVETLRTGLKTCSIDLPFAAGSPFGIDARLYEAMFKTGIWPAASPMQLVKLLAAGEISQLMFRIDEAFLKGGEKRVSRSIVGVRRTVLPDKATIWIADATANPAEVERMTGRPVFDATPAGQIVQKHPLLQIAIDITKRTNKAKVVGIVDELLTRLPYGRVGVICHREHVTVIDGRSQECAVKADVRARIARIDHFRSGASRGSNSWIDGRDCLIVLGTPRVPPHAIRNRLVSVGLLMAAVRPDGPDPPGAGWGADFWSGVTVEGRRRTVKTLAYRDHDWHAAHLAIVRSELVQAAGRGRSIADNGIPTIIVTTENLGLPLIELCTETADGTDLLAVSAARRLSLTSPKYIS